MSEFDKLWELEAKATKGLWEDSFGGLWGNGGTQQIVWATVDETAEWDERDLAFVVAARNAMPALKAAVEERDRLRAEVARLAELALASEGLAGAALGSMVAMNELKSALKAIVDAWEEAWLDEECLGSDVDRFCDAIDAAKEALKP